MKISDFDFELPEQLIAKHPTKERTASRLLYLERDTGEIEHKTFSDILAYIKPNDLLVINNSKVIPARVFGQKTSGGKLEILVERILNSHQALVHIKSSKSPKPNSTILLGNESQLDEFTILERQDDLFVLEQVNKTQNFIQWLNIYGHMPLPPYIDRPDEITDQERYQTVYAKPEGSVAAPTAGLHFDEQLLTKIKKQGTQIATLTLHVGAGTFQPVRTADIKQHHMHSEWISVNQETCDAIITCKKNGGKVIAVGTTCVRSLETAAQHAIDIESPELIVPFEGDTNIFIYPGKQFHIIDKLITNFHLPKSTLIMLVSAFAGTELIKRAYETAVKEKYRFFSYGDAMLIA